MQQGHVLQAMGQHYLFKAFSPDELQQLAAQVRSQQLNAEQVLFQHGDPAERFFLVRSGQIKLFRTTTDGQEKVMELMGPGRTFGEAIMFMERQHYPVNAQALQDSQLYAIPNQVFMQLLRQNPDACFRLLGSMSMRLHQRLNEVESLSLQNASHRLVHYLLQQLPAYTSDGAELILDAPKQVIASKLGMKPETFSRALAGLIQRGAISTQGRKIIIDSIQLLTKDD